jgi:hypothetical protein
MDTADSNIPPSDDDLKRLAESLAALRDAMVEFSLFMKDCQFDIESDEKQRVHALVQQALKRVQSLGSPPA